MIAVRRASERQCLCRREQEVWQTFHPQGDAGPLANGLGALALLNEVHLPPGAAVESLPLQDAEVITYVLKGSLAQSDSTGHSGIIRAGEFQRMTTGHRVRHSERNASQNDWSHFFRMSLGSCETELDFAREQSLFSVARRRGNLCIVVSPDGRKGSLRIRQDVSIYSAILEVGHHIVHELRPKRIAWLHVVRGEAALGELVLVTGDGVSVTEEPAVSFTAREETDILLLDMHEPLQKSLSSEERS